MTTLAIRGHATRGKEVIEILEMLGGENFENLNGNNTTVCYSIYGDGCISTNYGDKSIIEYSLEQFLEKFPYKVGDKVSLKGVIKTIKSVHWYSDINEVIYKLDSDVFNAEYFVFAYELQSYKLPIDERVIKDGCKELLKYNVEDLWKKNLKKSAI